MHKPTYRFLLINLPFSGHMNPALELSKKLTESGHRVTILMDPDYREDIEKTGATFMPYHHYDSKWREERKQIAAFKSAYDTAMPILADYDCLLYDALFIFGHHLAKQCNIPSVRLFSTFAFTKDHLDFIRNKGGIPINLAKDWNPFYHLMKGYYRKQDMLETTDFFDEMVQCTPELNIVYTSRAFQIDSKQFEDDTFKFVGPVIRAETFDKDQFSFAEMRKPIVYAAMGTILPKYLKKSFAKLIAAFKDFRGTLILSIGEEVSLSNFGDLPPHIHLFKHVPQVEVLKHADLFITHGGMNSVNESIYHGVPMLVSPMANDGPLVAKRMESLSLAKKIDLSNMSINDIKQATEDVLNSSTIQSNISALSAKTQQLSGNSAAVEWIEDYLSNK